MTVPLRLSKYVGLFRVENMQQLKMELESVIQRHIEYLNDHTYETCNRVAKL